MTLDIESIESESPDALEPESVFRGYARTEFQEWRAWKKLQANLRGNGGCCFAISGPRGSGKTWLVRRAVDDFRLPKNGAPGGIALFYPSPSEHDAHAFLASLSDSFATEVERRYRQSRSRGGYLLSLKQVSIGLPILIAVVGLGAIWAGQFGVTGIREGYGAVAVIATVSVALLALAMVQARNAIRATSPEGRLLREALVVRQRARFSATYREGTEFGAEAKAGAAARLRLSRESTLAERPATLSSLINDFRALVAQAHDVVGRVLIGIDELDKMTDPQQVRDLLRDIKGIFEVTGVYVLVSISDEAARNLNLGALTGRDELHSSFNTVIEAPPTRLDDCAELLFQRRRLPRDVALTLAVLAGGNPRELVRLVDVTGDAETGTEAVRLAMMDEAFALRREVVTAVDYPGAEVGQAARLGVFNALSDDGFATPEAVVSLAERALTDEMWDVPWVDAGWISRFDEPWRRLMVRLAVAGRLIQRQSHIVIDQDLAPLLASPVVVATQSARAARSVFEREFRLDTGQRSAAVEAARNELEAIAGRYVSIRNTQPPGSIRTREMTAQVSQARTFARDADFAGRELYERLQSDDEGRRIVSLACVQATGVSETLQPVLAIIREPLSAFEQYHALRAVESLRPNLSEAERQSVLNVLSDPGVQKRIAGDSSRVVLVDRLIKAIAEPD